LFVASILTSALAAPQSISRVVHLSSEVNTAGLLQRVEQAQPWEHYAFYVCAVLLVLAIIGLVVKAVKGPPKPATLTDVAEAKADIRKQMQDLQDAEKDITRKENGEDVEAAAPEVVEEPEGDDVDYEKLLRTFAQAAAQTVGPKLAKGQAVRNIFETKVERFAHKSKAFVMDEIHGTAGAVLTALGAQEAMLLLDWESAVDANFPPASILLAGVLSPVLLGLALLNHIAQALLYFLPIACLCIASLYIDQGQPCFIPSIFYWLWAHVFFATVLFLAHIANAIKIQMGKAWLRSEIDEASAKLKDIQGHADHGLTDLREFFICNCVIVQKALLLEDGVRRSIFNNIIGLFTMVWLGLTIWTFVVVLGWTFVPGTIAFHHSAADAAGDEYCGAWMTVLTARLCCIIGIVFLGINIMTVNAWFSDALKYNPEYEKMVLNNAKKIDDGAGGIPVAQLLVKAFVLRGSSDTLEMQMSGANMEKKVLEKKQYAAQAELADIESRIATESSNHERLKSTIADLGGPLQCAKKPEPEPVVKQRDISLSAGMDKKAQAQMTAATDLMSETQVKALADMDEAKKQAFLAKESTQAGLDEAQIQAMQAMNDAEKLTYIAAKRANLNLSEAQVKAMAMKSDADKKAEMLIAAATVGMDEAKVKAMEGLSNAEKEAYIIADKLNLEFDASKIKAMAAMNDAEKQAYIIAEKAQLGLNEAQIKAMAAMDDAEKQAYVIAEKAKEGLDEAQKKAMEGMNKAEAEAYVLAEKAKKGLDEAEKMALEAMSEAEKEVKMIALIAEEKARQALEMAKVEAEALYEATKRELELMMIKIQEAAERMKNSEAMQQAMAQAQEMAEQAEKQLEEGIEKLKEIDVEELARQGKEMAEEGAKKVQQAAEDLQNSEEVQAAIAKGKEVAKAVQEGDVEELKRQGKEGAEFAQKKGQELSEEAQKQAAELKKKAEEIDVEELKKQGKEMADEGVKKAGEVAEQAKVKGAEAVVVAKEKGAEAAAVAKEKGAEAAQKAGEVAEEAKVKGAEAAEIAKEKGAEAAEIAKEKGAEAAQKAGEVAEEAKVKGAEVAEEAKVKGEEAAAAAQEQVEKAKQKKGGKKK